MKFVDLAMGQQFELDGEVYVRSGPLVASHAGSGKQRFMARYMVIKPVGAVPAEVPRRPEILSTETVISAFDTFHGHCQDMLQQLEPMLQPDQLSAIRTQLEQERHVFLDTLSNQ